MPGRAHSNRFVPKQYAARGSNVQDPDRFLGRSAYCIGVCHDRYGINFKDCQCSSGGIPRTAPGSFRSGAAIQKSCRLGGADRSAFRTDFGINGKIQIILNISDRYLILPRLLLSYPISYTYLVIKNEVIKIDKI